MSQEINKINDAIALKQKVLKETKEEFKKEKEQIFSYDEFNRQKKFFKQSSGCWLGILVAILGIALVAFPELENGDSGKGVILVAGSIVVGIIVQKIKNFIFSKLVKKEKYEQYLEIEKREKAAISEILESIEDSQLDLREIEVKGKRANTIFIGVGLDRPEELYLNAPEKFEFMIDGVNYGNIKGVASFPVTPGRHVVTAKYSLKLSAKDDHHWEIEDSVPAVVVDVGEDGAFMFFELVLSMKNFKVFTDEYFEQIDSKEFNKIAEEYGSKKY